MRGKHVEQNNEKGITLLALVITIIVLMILAGITLTLVLGQNGIISKSQEAREASANADKETAEGLSDLDDAAGDAIKGIFSQVGKYKYTQEIVSETDNVALKDDEGHTLTVPAGFKIASDSATNQEDGIVIEDKDGNQFVWIGVTSMDYYMDYERRDFGELDDYSNYAETMPSDEQSSVNQYHGYYIGRYEAGDSVSTANKTLRASGASVTNKVSIKKGQAPYNFVTRDQANALATGMKIAEGYKATTKLCSSYAWDTAVEFMQNKISNYGLASGGNYEDATFNYTDITGASRIKETFETVLVPTGQGEQDSMDNICGIGGNAWEWTTETCTHSASNLWVCRGGSYLYGYSNRPAGYRYSVSATCPDDCINDSIAFRITLYI